MKHRIGLVFDGGGGKGAYQTGVWRALRETGLEQYVTDIAGTSVGGLNAVLFVKGDLEEAEHIWSEEISTINPMEIQIGVSKLIDKYLSDMSFISEKSVNCFLTLCNKSGKKGNEFFITPNGKSIKKCVVDKAEYFNMRFLTEKERSMTLQKATVRKEVLLATSALPVLCRSLKIDGNRYEDGGMADNSPVYPLLEATQCDTIITVHLNNDANKYGETEKYADTSVLEIIPSQETGHFFQGTVNFDKEHAKWLMELGYNDAKKVFEKVVKNWAKEELLTENGEKMLPIIEHLSLEEKYRLYNECDFLVHGNYAKLNYISEEGFGKTILRVFTGRDAKCKKQMLENTVALQEKMMCIMTCLDDEIQNLRQDTRFLINMSASLTDIMLGEHYSALDMIDVFKELANEYEYTNQYLANKYPDYRRWDKQKAQAKLDNITQKINARINKLNAIEEENWKHEQARIEAHTKRISEAKQVRILRFTPKETFIISSEGTDVIQNEEPSTNNHKTRWNKVKNTNIRKILDTDKCSAIILPKGNEHPDEIKIIFPADYFMYLWFVNNPVSERAGKNVCMMDYFSRFMNIYGYKVSDDGKNYTALETAQDNRIWWSSSVKDISEKIGQILNIKDKDDFLFYRTFETTRTGKSHFESRLDDRTYLTINKVDKNWEKVLGKNDGELFVDFVDKFINRVFE